MRLLKIVVDGITLFRGPLTIDFYTEQRVSNDKNDMVSHCFSNIYTNNVMSIVGINASGKTSLLKIISFVIDFINGKSVNEISNKDILNETNRLTIQAYFFDSLNQVCKLESEIIRVQETELDTRYVVVNERLWVKTISKIKAKKDLFIFDDEQHIKKVRDNKEEYLKDDTSIVLSISKHKGFNLRDLVPLTNVNLLSMIGDFPEELIAYLDPSIERISFDKETKEAKLKFYNKEEIVVAHPIHFEQYLSSGTIKGLNIFINAMLVFKNGGYLIVDELENHFNREIVATLIRFFMTKDVNNKGATLIFSTHYVELLDEFERNDGIFIVRNLGGISVKKLSDILKRNDIKKSEAFKSDFLEGTAPRYESFMKLKKKIISM